LQRRADQQERCVSVAPVRVALLVVAALLTAGCTTTVEGPPPATGVVLPPRPRDVRLEGVDPCSLLTAEQRAALGFTSEPHFSVSRVELFHGDVPTCTVHSQGSSSAVVGVGLVTTVGMERWLDPGLNAQTRVVDVAAFPGVITVPISSKSYCGVEVDVAAGQLLDVQVLDGGSTPPIPQTSLCDRALDSAIAAMQTLTAR
jgi:hypothetical protein